jgi:hypothetical protein
MIVAPRPLSRQRTVLSILGSASVELWCRSDVVSLVSGDVDVWDDLSGNGNDLVTPSTRPALASGAAPSGADCVRFTEAGGEYMQVTGLSMAQPHTILIAGKWTAGSTPNYLVSPPSAETCAYLRNDPPSDPLIALYWNAGIADTWTSGDWHLAEATVNDASSRLCLDNGTPVTGTISSSGNMTGIKLSDASYPLDFDATELVVVNRALTTSERAAVTAIMSDYAGI